MVTARTVKVYRIGTTVRSIATARGDVNDLGLLLPLASETPTCGTRAGRGEAARPAPVGHRCRPL
jgi:hypothetical protein